MVPFGLATIVGTLLLTSGCSQAQPVLTSAPKLLVSNGAEQQQLAGGSLSGPLSGEVEVSLDPVTGFDPPAIYITPGTDVTWRNGDPDHSYRVITESGADRSSGVLRAGASASLRFGPDLLVGADAAAEVAVRRFSYTATREDGLRFGGTVWLIAAHHEP